MRLFSAQRRNLILVGLLLAGSLCFAILSRIQKNPALSLVINEVCTYNAGTDAGSSVSYEDYIEIYNPTEHHISLENISLSDSSYHGSETLLPAEVIAPGGYYVVYAVGPDGTVPDGAAGLSFAISAEETITLSCRIVSADGSVRFSPVDSVFVPGHKNGTSYSRTGDGEDTFAEMHPSPGCSNSTSGLVLDAPVFSVDSGFYGEQLEVELEALEGLSVYYTLDGSTPTRESFLYTAPLLLTDPSSNHNLYASRDDIAAKSDNYVIPAEPVDKAIILQAIACDADGNYSKPASKTYFLGYDQKEGYEDVAVLSLVTDPDNLFDHEKGIYIRGKLYQDGLDQARITEEFPWIELMDYTNYYIEGISSERPVSLSCFDVTHNLSFEQTCGLRIRGNASRSFPQKSFSLFARRRFGNESFPSVFGGTEIAYSDLILNNSKELKKVFFFSLVEDRAVDTQKYTPCQVFLNGEYWGLYYFMEKYSAEYLEGYYGVSEEDALLIKATEEVAAGSPEDLSQLLALQEYLRQDMADPDTYAGLLEQMDMQSFIDWMCTNIYIANTDTKPLGGNVFTWKTTNPADDKYLDGRWRWMLYDLDDSLAVGMDLSETEAYAVDSFIDHAAYAQCGFLDDEPMPSLMKNEDFRKQFVLTFLDMANENFCASRVSALLDELTVQYREWNTISWERWNENPQDDTLLEQAEELRTFFSNRFAYIVPKLAEHFDLTGNLATVTLSASGTKNCGSITLNTITPDLAGGSWTGQYYTDYPVTLTAAAAPDCTFVGWEIEGGDIISGTQHMAEIELQFTSDSVSVKAVFQKN